MAGQNVSWSTANCSVIFILICWFICLVSRYQIHTSVLLTACVSLFHCLYITMISHQPQWPNILVITAELGVLLYNETLLTPVMHWAYTFCIINLLHEWPVSLCHDVTGILHVLTSWVYGLVLSVALFFLLHHSSLSLS